MLKVMIAEDDLIIADMAAEFLSTCGYEVCGTARTVEAAVALGLARRPDLAVIDLRLADGDLGTEILPRLASLGRIGTLYATGNMAHLLAIGAPGDACVCKPYSFPDLRRSLEIVVEIVATGHASPPFPRGFRILRPPGAPRG
ncbi:response regulator [Pinisolibacter aquiterrae]|uniref:response regulator n=1 Tax=Pinisolibacter aquiterrae TaxID=2815579 RepID=UPI001C3D81B7|nr:response regulator [Pinisolibacter aquiterrae]MBV5262502.1 hypothetical protein [Pinisolibacter aquiterrae]MCC8235863.1 hypothetical protein [Pinisolibacter aquiterrae]